MPKQQIKDYSGGINTRLNKHRIAENEAQNAVDVDLSGAKLKPTKTTNTTNPPSGDYKFKGSWITDADASSFEEYGNVLIKSYASKDPEFSTTTVSTSKALGVPSKPNQALTASVEATGSNPTTDALAYHTIETDSLGDSNNVPNSFITTIHSNSFGDKRAENTNTLHPVFKAGSYYYFFFIDEVLSGHKIEKWSDSGKIGEVAVTHVDKPTSFYNPYYSKWSRNDNYLISVNNNVTLATVVNLNSGNANAPTAQNITLQTIPSTLRTLSDRYNWMTSGTNNYRRYFDFGQRQHPNSSPDNLGYKPYEVTGPPPAMNSWSSETPSITMTDTQATINRPYSGEYVSPLRAREVSSSESFNNVKVKAIRHDQQTDQIVWELGTGADRYFFIGGWLPKTSVTYKFRIYRNVNNHSHDAYIDVDNHVRVSTADNLGWFLSTAQDNSGTDGSLFNFSVASTTHFQQITQNPYATAHRGGRPKIWHPSTITPATTYTDWSRSFRVGNSTITRDCVFAVWILKKISSGNAFLKWNGDHAFCLEFDNTKNTSFKVDPYDTSLLSTNYTTSSYNYIGGLGAGGFYSPESYTATNALGIYPSTQSLNYAFESGQLVRSYGHRLSSVISTNSTYSDAIFNTLSGIVSYNPAHTAGMPNWMVDTANYKDYSNDSRGYVYGDSHWKWTVTTTTGGPLSNNSYLNHTVGTPWNYYYYVSPLTPCLPDTFGTLSLNYHPNKKWLWGSSGLWDSGGAGAPGSHYMGCHGNTVKIYSPSTSFSHATTFAHIPQYSEYGSTAVGLYETSDYLGGNPKSHSSFAQIYNPAQDATDSYTSSSTSGATLQTVRTLWRTYFWDYKFIRILNPGSGGVSAEGLELKFYDDGEYVISRELDLQSGLVDVGDSQSGYVNSQASEKIKVRTSYFDQITLSNGTLNSLIHEETPALETNLGYTRSYSDENFDSSNVHGYTGSYHVAKRSKNLTTDPANAVEEKIFTYPNTANSVSTIKAGIANVDWGSTQKVYVNTRIIPYDGSNLTNYTFTGTVNQGTLAVASFQEAKIHNEHLTLSGSTDGYVIAPFANLAQAVKQSDHTGVSVMTGGLQIDLVSALFNSSNALTHVYYVTSGSTSKLYDVANSQVSLFNFPISNVSLGLDINTSSKYILIMKQGAYGHDDFQKINYVFTSDLTNKTIRDTTTNSLSGTTFKVLTDSGDTDKKYILVDASSYHVFNTSGFEINVYGSTWLPVTAIGKSNTLTLSAGMSSTTSIGTSVGLTQNLIRNAQVGDVVTGGSNTTHVGGKTAGTTTLTLANSQTNSSGVTLTFTRFMQKNVAWIISTDISNITVASSLPNYSALYANNEAVSFDALTNIEHQPLNKSVTALDGSTTYHLVVFDKNVTTTNSENQNGATLDSEAYIVGASNMLNADGPNIGFQYKYSQLRNIGTSNDPVLIEGPASDASESITLSNPADFIRLTNLLGNPSSDIDKYRVYRVGGDYASYGFLVDIDVSSSVPATVDDSARLIASSALTPFQYANPVPTASGKYLKHITSVSGIFFGGFDAQLRFSEFGNPHSWPETGYSDLDGTITGIVEYQGEGIVFTPNATYRVRGNNFDSMSVVKLPDQQGLPSANANSLISVYNTLFFISNDGLCAYAGGKINVISQSKLDPFPTITNVKGASKDNVLYFFGSSGQGVVCDLRRGGPVFSKLTETTDKRAFYVQDEDRLYLRKTSNGGAFQESATDNSITYTSRTYDFTDTNEYKVYKRAQVTYKGSGSITFTFDETTNETLSLSNSVNETAKYLEFSVARIAKQVEYTITGQIEVIEMSFDADALTTYDTEVRFENIDVTYRGSPVIEVQVDGVVKTMTPSLTSTNNVRTTRLYFPSITQGYLFHYRNTNSSGDIIKIHQNISEL